MEKVDEEISNSSRSELGDYKVNKEVSHASKMVVPECVDLTKDQFLEMLNRISSPIKISSPTKLGSIKATNPLVV